MIGRNWVHTWPLNDKKGHDLESIHCHCNPKIDWKNSIVNHNSFDYREIIEEAEQIIKEK